MAKKPRTNWQNKVQETILGLLKDGVVPWQKSWIAAGQPRSVATGNLYQNSNALLLNVLATVRQYESSHWLTFRKAKELGGNIRKGEKGTPVVWVKTYTKDSETDSGETTTEHFFRAGGQYVWNVSQCDGVTIEGETLEVATIRAGKELVAQGNKMWFALPQTPRLSVGGSSASFVPTRDQILMPPPRKFESEEDYWRVLWHEAIHWSHAKSGQPEGVYAFNELVAESGACMLCRMQGFTPRYENSAGYIEHWLGKIGDDPSLFGKATATAWKIVQWMTNADLETEGES